MTVSRSELEDEPFIPNRLRDPAEDPPRPSPPMSRRARMVLWVLLIAIIVALLGVSVRWVRHSSPSSDEESARCVDTNSRPSDGTHVVVDARNCESDRKRGDRRYRWESANPSDGSARGILELIDELLDGRRRGS